jgi:hypothetical protein
MNRSILFKQARWPPHRRLKNKEGATKADFSRWPQFAAHKPLRPTFFP